MISIVFMGTPEFAVPVLEALDDEFRVVGVVTQPDRPCGRGQRLTSSPVKDVALSRGLPVYQPCSLRMEEAAGRLAAWTPDIIAVAAFGQILPQSVLDLPRYGCLNVHASLLPRWRGAAPVAAAILHGDQVTGVTIMRMDAGLDTGDIVAQREEPVRPDDTRLTLESCLSHLGARLLTEMIPDFVEGRLIPRAQPQEGVTQAPCLCREDGALDWTETAMALGRRVRAYAPWPGTFTSWCGQHLKVLAATPLPHWNGHAPPGSVIPWDAGAAVATGEGVLRLECVQIAGKRPMDIVAFLRGHGCFVGSRLAAVEA